MHEFFSKYSPNLSDQLDEEDLYKLAVKELGLHDRSSKEDFKSRRKNNFLAWHPDKHSYLSEKEKKEFEEKFIKLEFYFKLVKNNKTARNQW